MLYCIHVVRYLKVIVSVFFVFRQQVGGVSWRHWLYFVCRRCDISVVFVINFITI